MGTQLSKFNGHRVTRPIVSDLCHSAFVSCDTISSERIAPLYQADGRGFAPPEGTRRPKVDPNLEFGLVPPAVRRTCSRWAA